MIALKRPKKQRMMTSDPCDIQINDEVWKVILERLGAVSSDCGTSHDR